MCQDAPQKCMTHCRCSFGSYTRVTCSERRWEPLPTQPVRIFGFILHDILDRSDMLISTGMPGIQCRLWHLVRANQSQSPCQSRTCQSHVSQPGLSHHVTAHLSEPCLSEPGLSETLSETWSETWSETLSETLSELHLSEPHVSEPELSETMSECTFIARIIRDYVRATLIRPWLSETISEPHLSQ